MVMIITKYGLQLQKTSDIDIIFDGKYYALVRLK